MHAMEDSIVRLGYIGVLLGTFLEGETTILLAGIFAKFEYLKFPNVVVCSFLGTFIGDCTFFFLGKFVGKSVIERYKFLRTRAVLSAKIIHQYPHLIVLVMRFLAGFRSIILLILGCANVGTARFLVIDAVSSMVWSIVVSAIGYTFAKVVYIFVSDIKGYEKIVIPLIIVPAVVAILAYRHLIKEKEEEQFDGD
jgi:membrane protein DedA with SNARE-associated domain